MVLGRYLIVGYLGPYGGTPCILGNVPRHLFGDSR